MNQNAMSVKESAVFNKTAFKLNATDDTTTIKDKILFLISTIIQSNS